MLPRVQLPRLQLDRGLVANPRQRLSRAALRWGHHLQLAELFERVDAHSRAQLFDLRALNAGHEAQMIVGAPTRVALRPPGAHVAVLCGLGVGRRCGFECGFEPTFHEPVVRRVLREPVRLRLEVVMRRHDGRAFGLHSLKLREQLRVHAELQDGAGPRLGGELRVDDFVRPRAELARRCSLQQEVRAALPAPAREWRLVDHVGALAHRGQRRGRAVPTGIDRQFRDRTAAFAQLAQIRELVFAAPLLEQHSDGVVTARRPARAALRNREIQVAQVHAAQMIREVGCRQPQQLVDDVHATIIRGSRSCGILSG